MITKQSIAQKLNRSMRAHTQLGLFLFSLVLIGFVGISQNRVGISMVDVPVIAVDEVYDDFSQVSAVTPTPTVYPVIMRDVEAPMQTAGGVYVYDRTSKTVLYENNATESMMPASTTKIMTALVALNEYDLEEVVTIKQASGAIGRRIAVETDQWFTVETLVRAILVGSGNDAAMALAEHHKDGYIGFVNAMNKKAKAIGLLHSNFVNVSGVESNGHVMSARDLAILSDEALNNFDLREMVGLKETIITDISESYRERLVNTNELLGLVEGVEGIKTGWTERAGECLVTLVKRGEGEVIIVVLGSSDRFGETIKLIDWVFEKYDWN